MAKIAKNPFVLEKQKCRTLSSPVDKPLHFKKTKNKKTEKPESPAVFKPAEVPLMISC